MSYRPKQTLFPLSDGLFTRDSSKSGWDAFQQELLWFMAYRNISPMELASQIGVEAERVRQWRRKEKPQRPAFHLIPEITRALAMSDDAGSGLPDLTFLPRKMGLLPEVGIDSAMKVAQQVEKLRAQRDALAERVNEVSVSALGKLVESVAMSRHWAVAVWPAVESFERTIGENTERFELHVADRLDFRRVDGAPIGKGEVWASFERELELAGAVLTVVAQPRWPVAESRELYSPWSVRRVGRMHSSSVEVPHANLKFVSVTSLTNFSWAPDLAAHLAKILGYGLTGTRELAKSVYGYAISEDGFERAEFQRFLQGDPRNKRVWSHWSSGERVGELLTGSGNSEVFHVYLKEDDALLKKEVARRIHTRNRDGEPFNLPDPTPEEEKFQRETETAILRQLQAKRDEVDRYITSRGTDNLIVLEVGAENEQQDEARRRAQFELCFDLAGEVVTNWIENGHLNAQSLRNGWTIRQDEHRDTLVSFLKLTSSIFKE